MEKIIPVTTTANGDEKAYAYFERHEMSPTGKGARRYRVITVNRGDIITEFREDMGKANKWKGVREIFIPSLWEHSVDELRAIADELRNETRIDLKDWLELDNMKLG